MVPPLDDRRAPRVPLEGVGVLSAGRTRVEVGLEDVSSGGCRVVSPIALRRGEAVYASLRLAGGELEAAATVAWCSRFAPYRVGLEFTRAGAERRARHVAGLAPRAGAVRPPLALAPGTRLRLGAPPHPRTAFSRDEAEVLLAARDGRAVDAVSREPRLRRALLKLLARGLVEGGAPRTDVGGWSAVLREPGAWRETHG